VTDANDHQGPFPVTNQIRERTNKHYNLWCLPAACAASHSDLEVGVRNEVNLRPTISRPVCPGVRRPSGTRDQFFFLLEIFFRQLRVCYFVAPFLTRGRVCNLLYSCFWTLPEKSTLGSKSRRTHGHILLFHLRLPPTWRARFQNIYPPGTGWPSYTPGHWVGARYEMRDDFRNQESDNRPYLSSERAPHMDKTVTVKRQ
jgi:hypothetical protein